MAASSNSIVSLCPPQKLEFKKFTSFQKASLNQLYSDRSRGRGHLKSYFSDEESDDGTITDDILKLAQKQDNIKSSRHNLMIKRSLTPMGFITKDSKINSGRSKSERPESNEVITYGTTPRIRINSAIVKERSLKGKYGLKSQNSLWSEHSDEVVDAEEVPCNEPLGSFMFKTLKKNILKSDYIVSDPTQDTPDTPELAIENPEPQTFEDIDIPVVEVSKRAKTLSWRSIKSHKTIVPLPVLEGFLQKKATNILKIWQKRYFVIKEQKLYYFRNQFKDIMLGCIDFNLVSVKIERCKDKRQFKIVPLGGTREFKFKAANEEECQKWYDVLLKNIQTSAGAAAILTAVVKIKRFWKSDRMSNQVFMEKADTGDILLFKTHSLSASIQRSFTRSEYDHIGLILRYSNGELVLFEASGKEGVGLCRWKTFMKNEWYLLFDKIVHRKLNALRTRDLMNAIEKFVRYSVGKKYQLSVSKLLKKKSANFEEEDRRFFCSELIAACYKKMNLLPKNISAAQYFPGSFAMEKQLELLNGARLGEEVLIDFNL